MRFFQWLRSAVQSRSTQYANASQWAAAHFPEEHVDVARRVAETLVDELNVRLDDLHASTRFIGDLKMTDLEPCWVITDLENEFHMTIPSEDGERLETIADLVQYLHSRLQTNAR